MEFSRQEYHFLLQGIFLTQRLNPHLLHLLHWQTGSLPEETKGSSYYAEWVLMNFQFHINLLTKWHCDCGFTLHLFI